MGRKVALGGILTAISIIFLYLAVYLPSAKLTMYFLTGIIPGFILVEMGARQAWLLYFATSMLSFLVLGNLVNAVPYIFIFGIYPLIKYYIEKTRNILIELTLKLLFFNIASLAVYFIWTRVFLINITIAFPIVWLVLGLQFAFLVYDYVFTRVIFYYWDKIRVYWRKDVR
ncbi:hypothetical protein [Lutispora saccharofermentans]|uniref:Uncharacterized protein n=1 Tax=Lutispora saccharofermentans TaxID=3024236 RepID=A0ABT1NB16_9FIRM|nr:hypothetical protein [Lutispora saccharofermentans]MCQ1528449.1 hypothetical protein [Lutispora saccharofermentans]